MHRLMGLQVRDRITGFTGTVTGHCEYISGCDQVLVQPFAKESGEFQDARWFDVQRVEQTAAATRVVLDNRETPGADVPAPVR